MSFPTNLDEFFKPQDVRKSVLHSQLLALECQVRVIKALDVEHSFGVEGSVNAEFLLGHARDLVSSAETIAQRAKHASKDSTLNSLRALRETAAELTNRARTLDKDALSRAKMRLDQCLAEHAGVTPESVAGHVPADPQRLAVKAGVSCFRAEGEQFKTFAVQVEALCDLALEFVYKSALESPAFQSSKF